MSPKKEIFDALAYEIVSGLTAIQDLKMRTYALLEKLSYLEAEEIAEILHRLLQGAQSNQSGYEFAMTCLLDLSVFYQGLGKEVMGEVYGFARQHEYRELVNLLAGHRPLRSYNIIEYHSESGVPLGMRIANSKKWDRYALDRLIHDGNPMVIRALLANPRLTEPDVVKIASRRPVATAILKEVYQNQRWIKRYAIKRALVFNPYTPPEIAISLINFLLAQDLQALLSEHMVHESLRQTAASRLQKLRPPRREE